MPAIVTLEGLREFQEVWGRVCTELSDACARAVDKGTKAGVASVRSDPQGFEPRTGKLQNSGVAKLLVVTRGGATGHMRWTAPYATIIELGSKPHEIWPRLGDAGPTRKGQKRRKKSDVGTHRTKLRWEQSSAEWSGGSGWVFATMVHHPGTTATHFSDGARQPCVDAALAEIAVGIENARSILKAG